MKGFTIGQTATTKRTFTDADLCEYAALAGLPPEALQSVPGPLLGGLFSYLLGTTLPGRGTNYLKQSLEFLKLVSPGEEITAIVEIVRLRPDKDLVNLRTVCVNAAGEIVCEGQALVHIQDVSGK